MLHERACERAGRFEQPRLLAGAKEIVVAGRDLVHEAEFDRLAREPDVAVGDPADFDAGAPFLTKALNASWVASSLPRKCSRPAGRDLAEHGHAALEFARGHLLEIDVVLLQEPVDVGNLRDDADAADDREGRGEDPVGDAGHQVAAARRDLVDADREPDLALASVGATARRPGHSPSPCRPGLSSRSDHLVDAGARDKQHGVDLARRAGRPNSPRCRP